MKILKNKNKRQLIFEFKEDENGTLLTTRVNGGLKYNDVVFAKKFIDERIKECQKQKKVNLKKK